ncbi:MAG: lipid-binding SYLF domain-containing protein [Gammaproteobacteria bacterium]|nr:lipid-binding SYLF domain-containing protein [Gammaproteobacteria bacterium]
MKKVLLSSLSLVLALGAASAFAKWDPDEGAEYHEKAQVALNAFKEKDEKVQSFIDKSAGYVVIPTVGKAGLGIGGARGKGVLYEGGEVTAVITLSQLSFGFQWGGQAYSEFIFFEDAATLENFKRGNYELNAQASAVAVTAGASADAEFNGGMAIFTQAKGGLMYEAAVGGQKFKVEAK